MKLKHQAHDFNQRTDIRSTPFYRWLARPVGVQTPTVFVAALKWYYGEERPEILQGKFDRGRLNRLQRIFNTYWRDRARLMEPNFTRPGFVDIHGDPVANPPRADAKGGYDSFVLWVRRDTDADTKLMGKAVPRDMLLADEDKFQGVKGRLELQTADPQELECFLQRWFGDTNIRLVRVWQWEAGELLPELQLDYTTFKHLRSKRHGKRKTKPTRVSKSAVGAEGA